MKRQRKFSKRKGYIYGLVDPRTEKVVYIGRTAHFVSRMRKHRFGAQNKLVRQWMEELRSLGLEPHVTILDKVWRRDLVEVERKWITEAVLKKLPLFNNECRHLRTGLG